MQLPPGNGTAASPGPLENALDASLNLQGSTYVHAALFAGFVLQQHATNRESEHTGEVSEELHDKHESAVFVDPTRVLLRA